MTSSPRSGSTVLVSASAISLSASSATSCHERLGSSSIGRLANHIGPEHRLQTIGASQTFMDEIDSHARQSAAIVHDYAGEWLSTREWESRGQIELEEARRFVPVALRKLRGAIKHEAERQ